MNTKTHTRRLPLALCLVAVLHTLGCGYGKVSPTTYDLAQSLYTVSNRKLDDQIDSIEKRIELARENGEVTAKEGRWLNAIVKQAKRQDWKKAMKSARRTFG